MHPFLPLPIRAEYVGAGAVPKPIMETSRNPQFWPQVQARARTLLNNDSERGIFFRAGHQVSVFAGGPEEVWEVFGRRWLGGRPGAHRPSDLAKESPQLGGGRDQLYGGLVRRILPGMFRITRYVREFARVNGSPFQGISSLIDRPNRAGENIKALGVGMAVKRHGHTRWNRTNHHAIAGVRLLR